MIQIFFKIKRGYYTRNNKRWVILRAKDKKDVDKIMNESIKLGVQTTVDKGRGFIPSHMIEYIEIRGLDK